ncbi:MAG TPA: acylphosphatase [Xanthobacteraceae bacterium]|jgi:acylphosphatase
MRVVRLTIRGYVQGVGYRAFVEDEAMARGLKGWVRNRRDGSVEALIAGEPAEVDAMIAACRCGPRSARVDAVEIAEANEKALAARRPGEVFSMLPTA